MLNIAIDNPLRFCLVGRGSIGRRHLANLKSLSCNNIIAFSESKDLTKDRAFKKEFGIETKHSLKEINDFSPDAFIISNPSSRHIMTARIAAERNCHIFMEKPLSSNQKGIGELRRQLQKKKLVFLLGSNLRFHPVICCIKGLIEKGAFGNIYFARVQAGQYLPDWHPKEDYRSSYSGSRQLGGGVVLTLQHELDYLYWFFGEFKTIKSSVLKVSDLDIDVEDIASVIIETKSKKLLELHLDYLQRPPQRTVQIQGSKGSINYSFGQRYLEFYDFYKRKPKKIYDAKNFNYNDMYLEEMKHFINCLEHKEEPRTGIKDASYILGACLKIKKGY